MENLREEYEKLNGEFEKKYTEAMVAISKKYDKDVGVAYDMLKAIARGNEEYGEGIDINLEELKKDYMELAILSEKILSGC